ncbi:hypothetical protein NKDENANG_00049 [Candidatus Entotheonellaceae bacterium PAL068K]
MSRLVSRLLPGTLGIMLMVLTGCVGNPPSRFYILAPLPPSETAELFARQSIAIGVGPVSLPSYLDRPQIVTHASRTKLDLAEFDQWAAPLQENFALVLAENLSVLLATDHVVVFPWQRSTPIDYQVIVDVTRFDGAVGGDMLLVARWSVHQADGHELMMEKSRFGEPIAGQDYEAIVTAMSRTLESLSRDIAAAVRSVSQPSSPR